MTPPAALISLATASPAHILEQSDVAERAREVFGPRYREFDRLSPVFLNTGIQRRQAVRPMEWYVTPRTWPERSAVYLEGAVDLFVEAATKALMRAGLTAREVDTVVTVSSTGIATPSLEARAAGRMGFRADVVRVPIFGLGCGGGVSGLAIAGRLAQSRPGQVVLIVCVELCTVSFRLDELSPSNMVSTALFGDGAAACVLVAGEKGLRTIEGGGEHMWPDTLDMMGWTVDTEGFGVIFSRSIPTFAQANLRPAVDDILARMDLSAADVDRFVCHPGGAKVIEVLERALDLGQGGLDRERQVLADHGNMSSPTVLFVLEKVLADPPKPRLVMSALGPAFCCSCLSLAA